ncbi:unnamed protein product [Brugia timori]|uniref:ZP domain-containing protein n=1 Tax=Brugia timori TaxID=42155 RepID=A0A0R3QBE2_9BILA|nr:unnamed protein product [Brugia timori]
MKIYWTRICIVKQRKVDIPSYKLQMGTYSSFTSTSMHFMTCHVQLRGFRVSADHTAVPDTTMKNSNEGDSLFEGRFRATRVINSCSILWKLSYNKASLLVLSGMV